MVRLNWSTVFCFEWGYSKSQAAYAFSVKDAAALGGGNRTGFVDFKDRG